jgi:glycosyltransferase involved in cell wall biosynthesis
MKNISLKEANGLFINKQYQLALNMYEVLYRKSPALDFYEFNIFMCKKKLGLPVTYLGSSVSNPSQSSTLTESVVDHFSGVGSTDVVFVQANELYLSLEEQLDKTCFYISPLGKAINKIYIISDFISKIPTVFDLVKYPQFAIFRDKIQLVSLKDFNNGFVGKLKSKVISYIFDSKGLPENLKDKHDVLRAINKVSGNLWRIHDDVQHHGSFYLKSISDHNDSENAKLILKNKLSSIKKVNKNRPVFAFGTGPSLKYAYCNPEIEQSIVIACNSVVHNLTMLDYLKPDMVCATDPIFHAGWGKYADKFRTSLIRAMEKFSFTLVVPTRDLHIFLHFLPSELTSRVASYEFDSDIKGLNNNLISSQRVAPRPNVLTNIMLPIASTITTDIRIGGCDGKKTSSGYFWEHDKSSQLNNQMEDIQKEFKGFFDIDYDKYYAEHCEVLKNQIDYLLAENYKVSSVTPSYIPCLVENDAQTKYVRSANEKVVDVAIVMPSRNMETSIVDSIISVVKSANAAKISYRVIVVNENSSDRTAALVKEKFASELESGAVLLVKTQGLGVSAARNVGLALSNSRYISFLDADDFISEDSLSARVRLLDASDDSVCGTFSKTHLVDTASGKILSTANNYKKTGFVYDYTRVHSPAHISSILYKSDKIMGLKFPDGVRFGEDWLFLSRALRSGDKLIYTNDSNSVYSVHQESVTKKSPQSHVLALFGILQKIYFQDIDADLVGSKFSEGLNKHQSISHVPEYNAKLSELILRLMACFYVESNISAPYKTLSGIQKDLGLEFSLLDGIISDDLKNMKDVFVRDVVRFSGSNNINEAHITSFLASTKAWQLLPALKSLF